MGLRFLSAVSFLGLTLLGMCTVAAADAAIETPASCRALARTDFSSIPDAPAQVVEARSLNLERERVAFCQVTGYVAPSVGFVLTLPHRGWNGKFIQLGCGGFCGSTDPLDCEDALKRGYACAVSNNGHRSTGSDALWAYNNLQAEIDHAYRAAHVTALASKAIVQQYYGQAPRKSYFMGTSTGGRQALLQAQRFPWDFDGIVAGVPSLSVTGIHMNLLWGNRAFTNSAGEPLFTQADLDTLNRAVLDKCDLIDGLKDGLLEDPRACTFDPREIACTATSHSGCLTTEQVNAALKIYGGARNSQGDSIHVASALKGSEHTWMDWFVSRMPKENPRRMYNFVREKFRYNSFDLDPGPSWRPEQFDFDRDYKRLGVADSLADATNPDLRRFKAAGGKLIAYAGWSDAGGMPLHTVDYYETVQKVFGGPEQTQDFFRLFMVPGMEHIYGEGAFAIDWLSYLEAWVEQGRAPDKLVGFHVKLDDLDYNDAADRREMARRTTPPLNSKWVDFSRPLYPYPTTVKYLGRGNPKDAINFGPASSDHVAISYATQ